MDPGALETLGMVHATQGRFEEALVVTERAYALMPQSNIIAGQLAALLARAGAVDRAAELIKKVKYSPLPGVAVGAALYHALSGEFEEAAQWTERAIDERYTLLVAKIGTLFRPRPQWAALAKLMNLPA